MFLIPCWLMQLQSLIEQLTFHFFDAAAPGFNSLIPVPSVPSLISAGSAELLCRASNISSTDPFCFVKHKQETIEAFLQLCLRICAAPPSVRRTKIRGDKDYHTALITIKQGDHHSGPNRNPKHNQAETKIHYHYSFRHVHVLTRIAKIYVVIYMSQMCGLI